MSKSVKYPWFKEGDSIITAYAESCSGPGWANSPVWVIVADGNRKLRQECIQPSEQDGFILTLYSVSQSAHISMTKAVQCAIGYSRKKSPK